MQLVFHSFKRALKRNTKCINNPKTQGETMDIQQKIKEELLKEVFTNIDNIYDFLDSRFKLDEVANETLIKKLNELKDVVYHTSQFCELS